MARELLERFDPNNPQLKTTPARPQGQRRASNQTPAQGTEVRQRRQQQTPHPVLMQRTVVMATPQVNRVQPPPAPVAMVTPAAGASTNQNAPSAQSQGAVTQEQASAATSQQFIPPGMQSFLFPPSLDRSLATVIQLNCYWCRDVSRCCSRAPHPLPHTT